jgi:hypothetical protein
MGLSYGSSETDLAVIDPQVEAAVRITADPCLVRNRCAVATIVAQRQQRSFAAFTATRQLGRIQRTSFAPLVRAGVGRATRTERSGLTGALPRIVALERLVEAKDVRKIEARIGGLADEQPEVDQREDNITNVGGGADSPMIEDEAGHHTISIEREIATRFGQLAARDVSTFGQARLRIFQRRQQK